MTKNEFLNGLEAALLEQMNISEAAPHIRYYRDYIENEINKGKTEEEVMSGLQNPRLIAKTIVDNAGSAKKYNNDVYDNNTENNYYEDNNRSSKFGFSINGKPVNSIILKIILGIILVAVLMVVLVVLGGIFWIISRVILPVVLIVGVIYLLVKFVKNNLW